MVTRMQFKKNDSVSRTQLRLFQARAAKNTKDSVSHARENLILTKCDLSEFRKSNHFSSFDSLSHVYETGIQMGEVWAHRV